MKSKRRSKNNNPGSFRPNSYWEDNDPLAAILRNVKSTNRRQMITDYWNAGRLEELFPENLADDPGPDAQLFLERLHPSFMGGAYLPDFLPTEVEIARIELKSVTAAARIGRKEFEAPLFQQNFGKHTACGIGGLVIRGGEVWHRIGHDPVVGFPFQQDSRDVRMAAAHGLAQCRGFRKCGGGANSSEIRVRPGGEPRFNRLRVALFRCGE